MSDYFPKPPPPFEDATSITEWVQQELEAVARVLGREADLAWLRELAVAPARPREGMLVHADGDNWDPGSGKGLYVYLNGTWVPLNRSATEVGLLLLEGDEEGIVLLEGDEQAGSYGFLLEGAYRG